MIPLHHYCSFNAPDVPPSIEVLELLLDAYPRSPLQLNKYHETPLHQYCGHDNPDPRIITCILRFCPTAASTLSTSGKQLPLHTMLSPRFRDNRSYIANIHSIKALILVFPDSITSEVTDDSIVMEFVGGGTVQTRSITKWSPLSVAANNKIISKIINDTMSFLALKKLSH